MVEIMIASICAILLAAVVSVVYLGLTMLHAPDKIIDALIKVVGVLLIFGIVCALVSSIMYIVSLLR